MIDRMVQGTIPDKPHTVFRSEDGRLRYEECITRHGFDGAFTVAYHARPPTEDALLEPTTRGWAAPERLAPSVSRRLFRATALPPHGPPLDTRTVLLCNDDVNVAMVTADRDDDAFLANNDGDDLYFLHQGSALLQTPLGSLAVVPGDYVWIPRSLPHRFLHVAAPTQWLHLEVRRGLRIPTQYVISFGQLKMDAPYSHRDFRRPTPVEPGNGPCQVIIKRGGAFFLRTLKESILDVVGWDGFVYPIAFPIEHFQPKTGQVHLPPTVHATFAAPGLLICSFVPRVTDTHARAIPCPYPHSSVDCDEVLFYVRGNFTSRRGVGPGTLSLHPAGIPHGPHPGAYEASIGTTRTEELAVMMDTDKPLHPTRRSLEIEDPGYHGSWRG